jgi:hypothetical protein
MKQFNRLESPFREELLRACVLLLAFIGLFFWFWGNYSLALYPVRTKAQVVAVAGQSFEYKYCVPAAGQMFYNRREVTLQQAQQLRTTPEIEVVYAANSPAYTSLPSIQRPLPAWLFAGLHLLTLWALGLSLRDLARMAKQASK